MKTTPVPPSTRIEALENRIAPAGLVTAVYVAGTGELTLTGDIDGNDVTIFQTGTNTYRVEGINTDIGAVGVTFLDIGKLSKLTIDGGDGSDQFTLKNLRKLTALSLSGGTGSDNFTATNLSVKGSITLHGNEDNDTFSLDGALTSISGNVTVDSAATPGNFVDLELEAEKTVIGGSVFFTGGGAGGLLNAAGVASLEIGKGIKFDSGAADGQLDFNVPSVVIGKLASGESILFTGGVGNDEVGFFGVDAKLAGAIRMTGGDSNDSLDIENIGTMKIGKLSTRQSILFDGGLGSDSISAEPATLSLAGAIDFAGGDGTNTLNLDMSGGTAKIGTLQTGQSIRFTAGTGTDLISTDVGRLTLKGGIEFSAGEGSNSMNLSSHGGSLSIGKLGTGQSILFTGGAGSDDITSNLSRVTMKGGIESNAGGGDNDVEFDDQGVVKIGKFGSGQSLKFTGTTDADNEVDFGGIVSLAGSVEVTGGTGSDDIDLDGQVSVGKSNAGVSLLLVGGDGDDDMDIQDRVTLAGSLTLDGGNDEDELDLNVAERFTVKGAMEMIGGDGDDRFDVVSFAFQVGKTLTFTGGDGQDTFSLDADGSIAGNVSVDLGPMAVGNQLMVFTSITGNPAGLAIKGSLTVNATAASTPDSLTISNLSVAKAVDLSLGDGNSTVNIDNLNAGNTFTLDTRGGTDVVNFERGNFFGISVIKKLATIQLGLGDDQLSIGGPTPAVIAPFPDSTRVNFIGGLTTDGGDGANDDRNLFENENTFGVAITAPVAFELNSLP